VGERKGMYEEILEKLMKNPHFSEIREILEERKIDPEVFLRRFQDRLYPLLDKHIHDNDALKEESFDYILPAIAMYRTMTEFFEDALDVFRDMWFRGAETGAAYLQKKASDEEFLRNWCRNITPKDPDRGAFLFDVRETSDFSTEYHVLKCPYVEYCSLYGCSEIVTVFCDSDDIIFGHIHPRLIWGRTKTIGRGDDVCDFKYRYLRQE